MKRIDTLKIICSCLVLLAFSAIINIATAQTNIALTAVATHSGGGVSASGYGPELYNDNLIPPPNTVGTYQWGWVTTGGWIEFTWTSAQVVGKVKVHKQNRPMSTCTVEYWNGTTYVNIMSYNNAVATIVDSMVFTPVSTTKIRLNAVGGFSNPNHGEIQIFGPNIPNDLSVTVITSPLSLSQQCYNTAIPVKALVKNMGSLPQSNFPVGARYTGPVSGTLSGTYTGVLAPQASDTVMIGTIYLQTGSYTIAGYSMLATDTAKANDTSTQQSFTVKSPVPLPVVASDTVCVGGNAFLYVNANPNGTYNWYSSASGGTLVNISNTLSFPGLSQDTTMYISALINGCESGRVPITAAIGPPPVVNLGNDTSFCENIPLILDAGNPGGLYTWSTGDSMQSITVTNQSGAYWVVVDKYCISSDTVNVTVAPRPAVSGISYVRMNNTYYFTASSAQFVTSYLWIFGDGTTSTLQDPIHTYAHGINAALIVKLVVSNNCGTDTLLRTVPTAVNGLSAQEEGVQVYPNPAKDRIFIKSDNSKVNRVLIVGAMGNIVLQKTIGHQGSIEVALESLPSGNYFIRVDTEEGIIHQALQVMR